MSEPRQTRIGLLDVELALRHGARLDRILVEARHDLVPPAGYLEPVLERARDAEDDPHRLLLVAMLGERPLGLVDARREPGAVVVSQIAVDASARRRGVARALLRALVRRSTRPCADEELPVIMAFPRPGRARAADFWRHLGFEARAEGRYAAPAGVIDPGRARTRGVRLG